MKINVETKEIKVIEVDNQKLLVIDGEYYSQTTKGLNKVKTLPKELVQLMEIFGGTAAKPAKKKTTKKTTKKSTKDTAEPKATPKPSVVSQNKGEATEHATLKPTEPNLGNW